MSHRVQPQGSLRFWAAFTLILFGSIALTSGVSALISEQRFHARAIASEGEIVAERYDVPASGRRNDLMANPNALELHYRDASGTSRAALMPLAGNEDLTPGTRFALLYDPQDFSRVRRGDRPVQNWFYWTLIGSGCAILALAAMLWLARRHKVQDIASDTSVEIDIGPLPGGFGVPDRFYALAGRPLYRTRLISGGADLLALEPQSGAFLPARELWPRLSAGSIDLDEIDEARFRQLGREWRARAMAARTAAPIDWAATGDGEFPYESRHDGHSLRLRVNDFPAEPLYSVIIAGQSVGELEDWPTAWQKA